MTGWENWVTFLCSVIIATIISLVTFFYDVRKHRQSTITQAITANRIEWISQVRTLVGDFICAYIDGKPQNELRKLKIRVQLFCRDKQDYNKMLDCMERCCHTPYKEELCSELISATQYVLQRVWVRMKIEGGQNAKSDSNIREQIDFYIQDITR